MPGLKYSLTFQLRGQTLRLTVYRLFKVFGFGFSLTKLEKVSNDEETGDARKSRAKE